MNKGRYTLCVYNPILDQEEVLDFVGSSVDFVPRSAASDCKAPISVIDEFTTAFDSYYAFKAYLDKGSFVERDEMVAKTTIEYKSNSTGKVESLETVYCDDTLNTIAKNAKDGKVDFSCEVTDDVFREIYHELRYGDKSLRDMLAHPKNRSYSVNEHNKALLRKIPYIDPNEDERQICVYRQNFASYREFRALYLNYKDYKYKKEKENEQTLGKK